MSARACCLLLMLIGLHVHGIRLNKRKERKDYLAGRDEFGSLQGPDTLWKDAGGKSIDEKLNLIRPYSCKDLVYGAADRVSVWGGTTVSYPSSGNPYQNVKRCKCINKNAGHSVHCATSSGTVNLGKRHFEQIDVMNEAEKKGCKKKPYCSSAANAHPERPYQYPGTWFILQVTEPITIAGKPIGKFDYGKVSHFGLPERNASAGQDVSHKVKINFHVAGQSDWLDPHGSSRNWVAYRTKTEGDELLRKFDEQLTSFTAGVAAKAKEDAEEAARIYNTNKNPRGYHGCRKWHGDGCYPTRGEGCPCSQTHDCSEGFYCGGKGHDFRHGEPPHDISLTTYNQYEAKSKSRSRVLLHSEGNGNKIYVVPDASTFDEFWRTSGQYTIVGHNGMDVGNFSRKKEHGKIYQRCCEIDRY